MLIITMSKRDVLLPALTSILPGARRSGPTNRVVIDTSAVIDGRIADIAATGFILGTLVVPRFVLDELQRIADSPDALRRNRGRRGLEMLSALQRDAVTQVEVVEATYPEVGEVDAKLMAYARDTGAAILTNDYNLNRVADLQGIRVLNINELANAVKSVVHPGEEMSVKVIQEGKEPGQGVGYLDDGTMIVVEGGAALHGQRGAGQRDARAPDGRRTDDLRPATRRRLTAAQGSDGIALRRDPRRRRPQHAGWAATSSGPTSGAGRSGAGASTCFSPIRAWPTSPWRCPLTRSTASAPRSRPSGPVPGRSGRATSGPTRSSPASGRSPGPATTTTPSCSSTTRRARR